MSDSRQRLHHRRITILKPSVCPPLGRIGGFWFVGGRNGDTEAERTAISNAARLKSERLPAGRRKPALSKLPKPSPPICAVASVPSAASRFWFCSCVGFYSHFCQSFSGRLRRAALKSPASHIRPIGSTTGRLKTKAARKSTSPPRTCGRCEEGRATPEGGTCLNRTQAEPSTNSC